MSDETKLDAGWYLLVHGDVEDAGADPAEHHALHGRHENRSAAPPKIPQKSERELADRLEFFVRAFAALAHNRITGCYAEFGTGRGSTVWCAYRAGLASTPRKIWSFDSFRGLPASQSAVDDHPAWAPGTFTQPLEQTRRRLSRAGVDLAEVTFVDGFYSETLREDRRKDLPAEIALAYVDCDLHSSTVEVLAYLRGILRHGMIIAFDDYYCWSPNHLSGEQVALAEWTPRIAGFRLHPYLPIGWHGQSFYVEQLAQ